MAGAFADRYQGQWKGILTQLGVLSGKAASGRDAPCPMCGGKDRFRLSDRGRGLWYCHGCDDGDDGVGLVMRWRGCGFAEAAKLIESVAGRYDDFYAKASSDKPRDPLKSMREASPDILGSVVAIYLRNRGIELTGAEARPLRFHPALWHWPTQTKWPAMIASVTRADGTPITCHQTFLQPDGSDKAPLEKPKLFPSGANPSGAGVWFGTPDPERELLVCEGIESALSGLRLYDLEAGCAALSTNGIRCLILPPVAKRVRVFADNDELQQGLAAAMDAARRWRAEGRAVVVSQSSEVGEDANDILLRRLRASA